LFGWRLPASRVTDRTTLLTPSAVFSKERQQAIRQRALPVHRIMPTAEFGIVKRCSLSPAIGSISGVPYRLTSCQKPCSAAAFPASNSCCKPASLGLAGAVSLVIAFTSFSYLI
jgi:hypothetical protein